MKALTPKERKRIYLEVAEILPYETGLCYALLDTLFKDGNPHISDYAIEIFYEFSLFEPPIGEQEDITYWWKQENTGARIICMLLCAEICNDSKE